MDITLSSTEYLQSTLSDQIKECKFIVCLVNYDGRHLFDVDCIVYTVYTLIHHVTRGSEHYHNIDDSETNKKQIMCKSLLPAM